jgi:hypothetical protein
MRQVALEPFSRQLTWDMSLFEPYDDTLELRLSGEYGYMYSNMSRHQVRRLRDALNEWLKEGENDAINDQ